MMPFTQRSCSDRTVEVNRLGVTDGAGGGDGDRPQEGFPCLARTVLYLGIAIQVIKCHKIICKDTPNK